MPKVKLVQIIDRSFDYNYGDDHVTCFFITDCGDWENLTDHEYQKLVNAVNSHNHRLKYGNKEAFKLGFQYPLQVITEETVTVKRNIAEYMAYFEEHQRLQDEANRKAEKEKILKNAEKEKRKLEKKCKKTLSVKPKF